MPKTKEKILVFADYYLPGYKAGGPINSIANMVKIVGGHFEFYIVTKDRDLGDTIGYSNITTRKWISMDGAKVMYLAPKEITFAKLHEIIKSDKWHKIYLNSFFSRIFSIKVILLNKICRHKFPILLAPRGEFYSGALEIKTRLKKFFLLFVKCFGLYQNVFWHFTDEKELLAAQKIFGNQIPYRLAMDPVLPIEKLPNDVLVKKRGELDLFFLSRIARNKNLHKCLEVLAKVPNDIRVTFDIYGPVEDQEYWRECEGLISKTPSNVQVNYRGEVVHKEVYKCIFKHHCLFLPTSGESFGHVIFETLSVGRPILIGENTPWQNLKLNGVGFETAPDNYDAFVSEIIYFANMAQEEFDGYAKRCKDFVLKRFSVSKQVAAYNALFE